MSTFESNIVPIEKLAASIEELVDKDVALSYFKSLFDKHEQKWRKNLKADYWRTSLVRKLLQVHERIKFTEFLESEIAQKFETRLYYPQLITYLRLTCFDQLGQPVKWVYLGDWLKSKKKKKEREEIIQNIQFTTPLEFTQKIEQEYQKIYGIKNAFVNFIRNVITNSSRDELFNTIKIRTSNESSQTLRGRQVLERDKVNYLYKIRNDFTHNTYNTDKFVRTDNIRKDDWDFRERIFEGDEVLWISTHKNFQKVLKQTVLIGLSERIKNNYGM